MLIIPRGLKNMKILRFKKNNINPHILDFLASFKSCYKHLICYESQIDLKKFLSIKMFILTEMFRDKCFLGGILI